MTRYDLADRSAIVTGAGSGIGRATAIMLAANGAHIVVQDLDAQAAERTGASIREAGGIATAVVGDIGDQTIIAESVRAAEALAPLRIAVNNAALPGAIGPTAEYLDENWQSVIDLNVNAVFRCMRAEIRAMLANGGGSIINVASVMGLVASPLSPAYVTSKHAVVGLTKAAAVEHSSVGVRVNAVGPGYIETPMLATASPSSREKIIRRHPIGRLGTADEVANLIVFLASDAASFMTGGFYPVDGGYTAL